MMRNKLIPEAVIPTIQLPRTPNLSARNTSAFCVSSLVLDKGMVFPSEISYANAIKSTEEIKIAIRYKIRVSMDSSGLITLSK